MLSTYVLLGFRNSQCQQIYPSSFCVNVFPFDLYVYLILRNLSSLSCTNHEVFRLLGPDILEYARLLPLKQVDVFQGASPPELFIHFLYPPALAKNPDHQKLLCSL
jgi:hypothetical protein